MEEKKVWLTRIGFKNKDKVKIDVVCKDIANIDKTFIYAIQRYVGKSSYDWMIIIKSVSKDIAFQRGSWFRHKVLEGLTYSMTVQ